MRPSIDYFFLFRGDCRCKSPEYLPGTTIGIVGEWNGGEKIPLKAKKSFLKQVLGYKILNGFSS